MAVRFTPGDNVIPYSTEYDFGDGITSRAGFDQTGNSRSDRGAVFGFDPEAIGVTHGPSYLPTETVDYSTCTPANPQDCVKIISPITGRPVGSEGDEPSWSTPQDLARFQIPFQDLDGLPSPPVPAPEPASLLLLAAGLAGLSAGGLRRHHARASFSPRGLEAAYGLVNQRPSLDQPILTK